ncbi:DUF2283 domain-containing protein [Candidatus Woesearchaeota archaeon]|nr:DUF2283 domain-containing protein [Candidatus Woesearchaeota archaeon]MBI2652598.1 DUF2283 domain-containing protein [Candidatus Woesearchaeota archaeon]MBI3027330.1 DUF2283 domain-containing protein [Candidatus Woesearchaeota archaeon]
MKKIRVFFDKEGNTLDVWFEKPRKVISEETGEEVILKKDPKTKKVIGFEKLNFISGKAKIEDLPVEVVVS